MNALLAAVTLLAAGIQSLRWLRVAQREHYLPSVGRFSIRWWRSSAANLALFLLGVVGTLAALSAPIAIFVTILVVIIGPLGLGLKGRTSELAWTTRMKATSLVSFFVAVVGVGVTLLLGFPILYGVILLAWPWIVDLALIVWRPLQSRTDRRWVDMARAGLDRSGARVVAITGSYGKTTTKGYLAHLLGEHTSVVASPASFNNRMGLARAINEHLGVGTDVFIAEMGTYGRGEIRELCDFIPPDVSVFTALGPVHLERMRTLENIAAAKAEIFERARVGVIAVDDPLMAAVADEQTLQRRIVTVSVTGLDADVTVDQADGVVRVGGEVVGRIDPSVIQAVNAACAVATLVALEIPTDAIANTLASLPTPQHRQVAEISDRGFLVIDDTFNANPAGGRRALDLLSRAADGRKVVVTPGMVELGPVQAEENEAFGREAAAVADDLLIVGRTNRMALAAGARASGGSSVHFLDTRESAVAWVREELQPGDAVLYENDLPDHYP